MRAMRRKGMGMTAGLVLLLALVALLLPLQSANAERLQLKRGGRSVAREPLNAENDEGVDVAPHATEAPARNSAMAKVSKLRLRARSAADSQSALASGAASLLRTAASVQLPFQLPSKVNRRGAGGRAGRAAGNGGQSGRRAGDAASNGGQSGRRGGDAAGDGGQSGRRGGTLPVSPFASASAPANEANVVTLEGMGKPWPVRLWLRNQGDAATCWAHSALSLLELRLQMAFADRELKEWFSIDQVVKCVKNAGIDGGNPLDAIEFLLTQKLMTDREVRSGKAITCDLTDWSKLLVRSISAYSYMALIPLVPCVNPGENCARMADYEFEMDRQFAMTPMLAYVDASQWHTYNPVYPDSWTYMFATGKASDYTPLVFPSSKCSSDPAKGDHLVLLLGTVTCPKTKKKYWRVYNSWGKEWGVKGYIYLEYEKNACGLANYPVGLADHDPNSIKFDTNRAMLMLPKTMTRAQAVSAVFLKNAAGTTGGKEVYDAVMAAAKKK